MNCLRHHGYLTIAILSFQAEVEGQKITWLTPHALQQVLPEVDYRVLLTFLEFYEVCHICSQSNYLIILFLTFIKKLLCPCLIKVCFLSE